MINNQRRGFLIIGNLKVITSSKKHIPRKVYKNKPMIILSFNMLV